MRGCENLMCTCTREQGACTLAVFAETVQKLSCFDAYAEPMSHFVVCDPFTPPLTLFHALHIVVQNITCGNNMCQELQETPS